jgi:hypothetical protein
MIKDYGPSVVRHVRARRVKKNPILAVMAIPELWHSIQMRAVHAELQDRRLLATAKRFEKETEGHLRGEFLHPGRYICRALRPVMKSIYHVNYLSLERRRGIYGVQSCTCNDMTYDRIVWLNYRNRKELVNAVRTNGLHKAPSRLNAKQLVRVLMTATA